MTERITRTYDVEWYIYEPYTKGSPETVYGDLDEMMEAARRRIVDPATLVWVQIGRREVEVRENG